MRLLLVLFLPWANCLRVLSVLPSPTKSHYLSGRRILQELLRRGHEVISISPFKEDFGQNFTWVEVEVRSIFDAVPDLKEKINQDYTFFGYQKYVWSAMNRYTSYITKQPKLAAFLRNDSSHFDVIFAHDFFMPIFYVLPFKYNAPLIVISTFGHAHYIDNYMGSTIDYSISHEFSRLKFPLSFYDRLKNFVYINFDVYGRRYYLHGYQNGLVSDVFGMITPDLKHLERNITAVLINSHHTMTTVKAMLPNIVEIGGVHIEDVKPLQQDLQEILDGAEHGAILLSLGSIIQLDSQKEEFISNIIQVLASLEQRVILKWNSDREFSEYKNIYTFQWLPQNDILAHPNLLLFINHGGTLGNQEAIFHGVPTICIPFQAMQPFVCESTERLGYGIHIPKKQVSDTKSLNNSIRRVLNDKRFKLKAVDVSRRFKDKPISSLDLAVFWIENASRHKVYRYRESHVWMWSTVVVACVSAVSVACCVVWRKKVLKKVKKS